MKKTILCMGIGAGLMYLFDPELGEVRRGLLKDRLRGTMPQTEDALSSKAEAVVAKATELTQKADAVAAETIQSVGADVIATSGDSGAQSGGGDGGGTDGGGSDNGGSDSGGSDNGRDASKADDQ